ncbi:hypothetical protein WT26_23630 [Burkholderia cepacia]|uniref:DUF2844 domain-containing protein n=2 Tax=Burkholderia cepacia complex TaxID=87882 RepID=A0A1B4PYD6_BURCE|nr:MULTISPECIES: DUF2844 domain-containing protein [Burkholderia cepacia complex]AOK18969.1 hypothetical protein WT26_23630 [Burkholderia cepacia]AOK25725.1 hypothetical protein WK67_23530 [Burkholderia ubonensis]KVU36223.1 hypothetical protein WK68_18475 [Burkholderia ubonensis]
MNKFKLLFVVEFALSIVFAFFSVSAHAVLGGDPRVLQGGETYSLNQKPSYTVKQTNLVGGTALREYLDSDGIVFAVAWNGPFTPNLAELFGPYMAKYQKGLADLQAAWEANPRSRPRGGVVIVRLDDFVSSQSGRFGYYMGGAWLPDYLPVGVNEGDFN